MWHINIAFESIWAGPYQINVAKRFFFFILFPTTFPLCHATNEYLFMRFLLVFLFGLSVCVKNTKVIEKITNISWWYNTKCIKSTKIKTIRTLSYRFERNYLIQMGWRLSWAKDTENFKQWNSLTLNTFFFIKSFFISLSHFNLQERE